MQIFHFLHVFWFIISLCNASDDGLTTEVTWDPYSLSVSGERVFIYSAEFHYQRLPVPELWLDVFQKFKANGFNAISPAISWSLSLVHLPCESELPLVNKLSVYFFWSYHSPSKGVYDFETPGKDLQRLFDTAKEAGLYVVARAGPYCNAETNAGGLALYLSDGSGGRLRTSDQTYYESWLPWIQAVGKIIADNQITNGGPVILNQIENELQETVHQANNTLVLYMEQVESAFRDAGVIVPFSSNEKGERSQSWSTDYEDVGGAVNVYGLDSYPGGLSCTNPNSGFNVVRNYYQWFQNYSFTQPEYFPEFEGGYFTPWGGSFYDDCTAELSPDFPDVYYKNNIGQKTTLLNLYMAFGGTNWGQSAAPVVYTSYDYSAPLRETRQIRDKMSQNKLIGLFTRVSGDLLETNMEGNGTNYTSDASIWTWALRNPDTGAAFYTLQHATSSSRDSTTFSLNVNTSRGPLVLQNINLNGRQSKIVVTDYKFGRHTLLYSTADILTYGTFDEDVIALYSDIGQMSSFAFRDSSNVTYQTFGQSTNFTASTLNGTSTFIYVQGSGSTVVQFSNGAVFYLLDTATAWTFSAPATTSNPNVSPDSHVFVIGPYLVRSADVTDSAVHLTGDTSNSTTIEVYAGNNTQALTWNGSPVTARWTSYGSLIASLAGPSNQTVTLPVLTSWLTADSLPEASLNYSDSGTAWRLCNKTTTLSPTPPLTLPVLFSSDYSFYTGIKVYRGRFLGAASGANVTISGGVAAGASAWLNGVLVGSYPGNASVDIFNLLLTFPPSALVTDSSTENVLTVLTDYTGHDETSTRNGVENPRGILGASLFSNSTSPSNTTTATNFTSWQIAGNAGGSSPLDSVRGPLNEGGLYGERVGFHLPGFPFTSSHSSTSSSSPTLPTFTPGSPLTGLPSSGVSWYTTTFSLNIAENLDVPLGIRLSAPAGTIARVQLFINGYQYGKFVPHIGPQTTFPVPPGILNMQGENLLGLSLWAMTDEGARLDGVEVVSYGVYESGFGFGGIDGGILQPGWEEERMLYG
ncbi:MAG: hypothetical protein Q9227_000654 [Pyrenula ochraceoflavens]